MKKIISFMLAAVMLVLAIPTSFAAGSPEVGKTTITLTGSKELAGASYDITVPAKMAPGESANITVSGYWPSDELVCVSAPKTVTLRHGSQSMDVNINFNGIRQAGNDLSASSATSNLQISEASALFGTWTGILEYDVEVKQIAATFSDGTALTWEELKLAENGTKYHYNASAISDTAIGNEAFYYCTSLTSITIPNSVTSIGEHAFAYSGLTNITFAGTVPQWNAIDLGGYWYDGTPATYVQCSDGTVTLS